MNCFFKILLCFAFFTPCTEALRAKILEEFDQEQEKNGYYFLFRIVHAPKKFEGYTLHYYGFKNLSQDEARKQLVTNLENILSMLNSEKKLENTFSHYPLTYKDIELLYVNFEGKKIRSNPPYVAAVSNRRDLIEYRFNKNDLPEDDEVVTESYLEAYEKVYGHPRQP